MTTTDEQTKEILDYLSSKDLRPTEVWLETFVNASRPSMPLAALKQTALFRILASDFRQTLQSSPVSIFPRAILNATIKRMKLPAAVPVQVTDIEDVGRSRWSQLETIEAAERGETTRGREIIRVVESSDDLGPSVGPEAPHSNSPFKLILQDSAGTVAYGFELLPVPALHGNVSIGTKLILKNANVARGVVLLEPATVAVLGGKIDALDKAWKQNRKQSLLAATQSS